MAYPRAWDETAPNGATADAATLDTIVQNLKTDLRLRLFDAGIDLTLDPTTLVLPTTQKPGVNFWAPWHNGMYNQRGVTDVALESPSAGKPDVLPTKDYIEVNWDGVGAVTLSLWMPIFVPTGSTFDNIKLNVYRDAGAAVVATFYKSFNGAATSLGTVTSAATGWHQITIAGPFTLAALNMHYIEVALSTNAAGTAISRLASYMCEDI